ncbi:MAG: hypothetical protein LWY06_08805 [Firmicutes bacterium]|nr:hypothetical protein [Bacillota bacterium]
MSENQKKKKKTSPLRIAAGVILFLLLFYAVSSADNYLTTIPHFKDYNALWTKDGKSVVFTRWYLPLPGKPDYFEIIKTGREGGKGEVLFKSQPGYNVFNIRRIQLSNDGTYLNIRLNKQQSDYIHDFLYKIPLDKTGKTESWELEKKHLFDIFLAFHDDKAIVRKMTEDGKVAASILQICNFSDRKVLQEIPYKNRNIVCVYADFYGNDDKPIFLNRISNNGDVSDSINQMIVPDAEKTFNMKIFPFDILYLPKEEMFVGIDMSSSHILHLMDIKTGDVKTMENPGGNDSQVSLSVSSDKSELLIGNSDNIFRINPVNGAALKLKLSTCIDGPIQESPDGKTYLYSNGTSIYTINRDGSDFRQITELSPLAEMMKNNAYRSYMEKRNILIHYATEGDHH